MSSDDRTHPNRDTNPDGSLPIPDLDSTAVDAASADQVKGGEIGSFSFGVENPTSIESATGGAGAGKIKFN
jgi:hypothetical protein